MSSSAPGPAKSRNYFIIGFAMLFVMGITWSLDASFVYTSLGAATFFFFLAYNHRAARPVKSSYKASSANYRPKKDGLSDFLEALATEQSSAQKPRSPQSSPQNVNATVIAAIVFIGGIFAFILIAILVSDDAVIDQPNTDPIYEKAERARYAGNYDSAEYYYRKIIASEPDNLDALNGLGIVSLNRQRYENALNQFDDALRVDADFQYARYNKALTFYYQHNYKRSLNETFDLMSRAPDYFDAMALAGDNYYAQQRYDSAKYWYVKSYDNGVRTAWLCHVLGYLYDKDAETEKAVALYQESLSYDSAQSEIYTRLAEMYPGEAGNFYRAKALQYK